MSLLMDALKRAEKARQAQAEKADAPEGESENTEKQELSLDPLHPSQALDAQTLEAAAQASGDHEFADAAGDHPRPAAAQEPPPGAVATGAAASQGPQEAEDSMSISMDFGDLSLDDTSATLPSMKSAQRSVDDYFDGTHSMSMSMEQVRGALEEDAVGAPSQDHLAGTRSDATTKETARAVFDAKAAAPPRSSPVFSLLILPLLLLVLIGGAGFVYWDDVLKLVDTQPTLVVNRPPPPPPAAPAPAPAAPVATAAPDTTPAAPPKVPEVPTVPMPQTAAAGNTAAADSSQPLSGTLVTAPAPAAAAADVAPTAMASASAAEPGSTGSPPATGETTGEHLEAMTDQDLAEAMPAKTVDLQAQLRKLGPANAAGSPVSLRITHHRQPDRLHQELLKAYEAFQLGDNDRAMAAYRKVLKRRPDDRNARMGIAALEVRAGNLQQAMEIYYRLLSSNPRDALVQSALISLREDVDPVAGESTVKSLLQIHPDSANLHFNLGNLFARQLRWTEAQQAYFDAYRLDVGNPDYAYNLAISLDHLAKARAALQFYQLALELADANPASFARAEALQRIGLLSAAQ